MQYSLTENTMDPRVINHRKAVARRERKMHTITCMTCLESFRSMNVCQGMCYSCLEDFHIAGYHEGNPFPDCAYCQLDAEVGR